MRRKKASPSMRGARPKLKPNPPSEKNKNKKREGTALFFGVEYTSDDEEEYEKQIVIGVGSMDLAEPGPLFK
jgi:hypothetical protein